MKKRLLTALLSIESAVMISPAVVRGASPTPSSTNESVFGTIQAPAGVAQYNAAAGGGIGLVTFISNLIRVATVIAGIWVMINFIMAGWAYITGSGDSKAHSDASAKMTYSMIGLAVIVGAYTIAALVGLIFFGDASYIINPRFEGVGAP